jgi:isoleucyl-tRNA synthetase
MSKPNDLKGTLNLPYTDFPMKANLPRAEPAQLAKWEEEKLYEQIQVARADAPSYVLHDGPPYPTGTIHLGTALNKILKDVVVKSKTMSGFRSPYIPGWDCHGLPIETQVEKQLGRKGAVGPAEFRKMCREFATRYVNENRRDFKRLGVFGRWEKPYLTMDPEYEACIADAFLSIMENGYVYRGLKPVYWCIYDSTALAEAEVEYEDHTSPSIWVRFALVQSEGNVPAELRGKNAYAIIWTTTPWTIPHSMVLAFHPSLEYSVVEAADGAVYLMAKDLMQSVATACGIEVKGVLANYTGRQIEEAKLKFSHPFLDRKEPAVLAEYVTLEQGTGIVHTAPGHGADDFVTGQKYGIETLAPLDDQGRYTQGLPEYKGKTVFEANPAITALLKERGALMGEGKLTHSYPHCWRCHKPVIFRATEQWFIKLDGVPKKDPQGETLRQRALREIPKIGWTPEWGQSRMYSMIAERPDWCVSRQRYWGVPIPVFYCGECGELFDNVPVLRNVIEWFKREGADAWYQRSAEELLPPGTKCTCGSGKWRKESDILDVWFDSGSSHLAVLGTKEVPWPADMYLEGPDQFRGWFHSSLLVATGVKDAAPYRQVVTYGWALDEHGRPMSKSLGNIVLPSEICDKYGADILRLWVVAHDYTADVRMSENVMKQLAEAYRKIRNTFRFALSNLSDFNPWRDAVLTERMLEIDRWMMDRTAKLIRECQEYYDKFEYHRVYHALHDFAVVELSAFYFDILKDRLYTFAATSEPRRSGLTAVWKISDALLRLIAPILVFTAEEVWKHMPKLSGEPATIHAAYFPKPEKLDTKLGRASIEAWEKLAVVRGEVLKALEAARNAKQIASGLEARVELSAEGWLATILPHYAAQLPALFIVSQVSVEGNAAPDAVKSAVIPELKIAVRRADGAKCERCWNYSVHVGESSKFPSVCERCLPVVDSLLGGAAAAS